MITTTFSSAAKLANFLKKYAVAMDAAFDTKFISNDMKYHVAGILDAIKAMRADGLSMSNMTFFVRTRGVEVRSSRVEDLGDFLVSVINVYLNVDKNVYKVEIQ